MNSEIYLIDNYANNIDSIVHRSSYLIKLVFTGFLLFLIILTQSYVKLLCYIGLVAVLILLAKLPLMKLLSWAIYPLLFGAIFALSQAFISVPLAATTLLRVFATVLLMLFFATSTGFTQVFSIIPSKTLRNTFLLTYRFFFMIIASLSQRLKIMNVRGIRKASLTRKFSALSDIIAHELIHTIEKAERVYRIMLVRGFKGKLSIPKKRTINKYDLLFLVAMAGVMLIWVM